MIEVEKRGLLSESEYNLLRNRLLKQTVFLGADNKYVEYFIYSDKLLKIVRNISKNNAMLSLKLNSIGNGASYDETEVKFKTEDFDVLHTIISNITKPEQLIVGTQKRENYKLNDVEIAIKWSEDWGYHFELECLIDNKYEIENALMKITEIAEIFDLKIMSDIEEREFISKIRSNRKK